MNSKSLNTLEYNKIIGMLASKAISPMGKQKAAELEPSHELGEIKQWQKETTEATAMILRKGSLPLGGIKDIRASISRAMIGGILSIEELMGVNDFLYVCSKAISYAKNENKNESYELLEPMFGQIQPLAALEKEITRCIVSETEVADDASPALGDIRRNIKTSNNRIREQLNSIIHSQAYKSMLQDSVITIRSDRFCVPVKFEFRGSFPGMIHDQSSSGSTVFMEPMSVVQLNNKLKELHSDEKNEISKILAKLSALVGENGDILSSNTEALTDLDFIFAKGELSLSMNATEPLFNTDGYVNVKKARHPLLNKQSVVPTDIYIGKEFTTLLITGPNTGGKTVSLKTLGLFTLMGQAGLHIAAFDNSELNVFDDVYADIGDEQSIEQSLSTFSSHMSNIVKILDSVTDNSLVLLDELGAGTDPTEGAALAIAIIKYLRDREIRTAVTTHYSELKVFALSTDGVENASCEFDVDTLRPTYKLLIGIPGKSNAFAISQKLGLPDHIISSAKDIISHEDARFEDVITDLELSKRAVEVERERARVFRNEAEKLKTDLETQKQKLATQRDKIILEAKDEARRVMRAAKDEADAMMKELMKQSREGTHKDLEAARQKIGGRLSEMEQEYSKADTPAKNLKPAPKNLRKGERVFIHTLNQTGTVTSLPDASGDVMVQAGIMKIKVNIKNLSLDESDENIKINNTSLSRSVKSGKSIKISPEIDLRGNMVDEGIEKTDKYLDDAFLSGLNQVTIIHGKGTGALRSAIQTHLKKHPHVKSFRLGAFGEGEAGVTIVELQK